MSKLSEAFNGIISQLHWGPGHRPFMEAVIAEHDALVERVEYLENTILSLMTPTEEQPHQAQEQVPHPAITNVDPIEVAPNPAIPGIKTADLPSSPEPEAAGPDSAL